jgi:biotin carboxyl carrier protein
MKDYSLKINGNQYDISIEDVNEESTMANVTVNGVAYEVEIVGEQASKMKKPQVVPAPKAAGLSVTPTSAPKAAQAAAGGPGLQVKSPLPGTILSVNVKEGDRVAPRQTLFVLEAMKMENNIDAERGGVVKSIHVQKGATVMEGDLLIVIE